MCNKISREGNNPNTKDKSDAKVIIRLFKRLRFWLRLLTIFLIVISFISFLSLTKSCNSNNYTSSSSTITRESRDTLTTINNAAMPATKNKTNNHFKNENDTSQKTISSSITTTTNNSSSDLLDSIVYNLTLAVNSVNNVLTGGSIALGLITLFIGIAGLFGFHTLKEDIKEHKREISKYVRKIESLEKRAKINRTKETAYNKSIESISHCIAHIGNGLDNSVQALATQMGIAERQKSEKENNKNQNDESSKMRNILEEITRNIRIMQLYQLCLNNRPNCTFALFAHFKAAGTESDHLHLQYVADNCLNKDISKEALETIGYINNRLEREKEVEKKKASEKQETVKKQEQDKEQEVSKKQEQDKEQEVSKKQDVFAWKKLTHKKSQING